MTVPHDSPCAGTQIAMMSQMNESQREQYMRRCIELAQMANQGGDAPVGALIVRADQVIAEAMEEVKAAHDIAGHAELIAVRLACRVLGSFDLSGCTMFTTAEPCFMCSYAIRQSRISEVVVGANVAEVGGASSKHPILSDASISKWASPPNIVYGVLRSECDDLPS